MKRSPKTLHAQAMSEHHFYCVFCGSGIDADPGSDANLYECPECRRFTPAPPAPGGPPPPWAKTYPPGIFSVEVKFPCPKCGRRLGVEALHAGGPGVCPICSAQFQCPQLSFLTAPPPEAAPPPLPPAADTARTVIRLSREEIDFLSQIESSPARPMLHAS